MAGFVGGEKQVKDVLPTSINTPFFDKSRTKLGYRPMGIPPF